MMASHQRSRLRVAVASEQSLVNDSVSAALVDRGFDAVPLRWPGEARPRTRQPVRREGFAAGLLVSDLDRWSRLRAAGVLLSGVHTPWVVLTGAPRGPLWGAALELGAGTVLSSTTSLEEVIRTLRRLARGRGLMGQAEQDELREAWNDLRHQRELLQERARSLTPREREVLLLLYGGEPVQRIAALFDVSPATVRSQVKSVLRKLEVNSQLAAVAAIGSLMELEREPTVRS